MKLLASRFCATTLVHRDQELARLVVEPGQRLDDHLQLRHVEAGGQALAGDVGDEHADHRLGDGQEVVVVAGDFARRFTEGGERQARDVARRRRQQLLLDVAGRVHLLLHAALLGHLAEQRPHLAGHRVERLGQLAQLIAGPDRNRVHEVAVAEVLRAGEQVVDRAGDLPGEEQADHQRHELDDEEQAADQREHRRAGAGRSSSRRRSPRRPTAGRRSPRR